MTCHVVVSDIHGNYPALDAVIEEEGSDTEYIFLGDIHGLNGYPKRTINSVKNVGTYIISGNHDKAIFEENEGHVNSEELAEFERNHTRSNLSDEEVDWMANLPHFRVEDIHSHTVCMTHASPYPEEASGYYANSGMKKQHLAKYASSVGQHYDFVLHGHTHEQYFVDASKWGHNVIFINPGSIGYDKEYAVVNIAEETVDLKSVQVDEEAIKSHIQRHLPSSAPSVDEWY